MRTIIMMLFILILTAGCANNTANTNNGETQRNDNSTKAQSASDANHLDQATDAERLELLAKTVPGVNHATCVVIGNTAIVGLDVDGQLDRSKVGTLKYAVAEVLRTDPYGVNALITADLDIRNRLQEIQQDIRRGKPISGFADELADMIGRLMPQIPRDIPAPDDGLEQHNKTDSRLNNKQLSH